MTILKRSAWAPDNNAAPPATVAPHPADTSGRWKKMLQKITNWELWPSAVLYAPLMPIWFWYCFRARSVWFFTAGNPTIEFGGYEGETKSSVYDQLPKHCYPRTIVVQPSQHFEEVLDRIDQAGFQYPFIVKPDRGRKGLLFRKIDNAAQLKAYHEYLPFDYVVQDLMDLPMELGVFYVRHPAQQKGQITGIILREALEVWGDGVSTLRQLIERHPQASKKMEAMTRKHEDRLEWIPADRERFVLSFAINRSRGARLRNLSHEADPELTAFFDRLNLQSPSFFWGRYDIKCVSIADLKQGKNYSVLEYNGTGSSPSHIYHCGMSLRQAYAEILRHWDLLYDICIWNKSHGVPYWPFWKGLRYLRTVNRHLNLLEKLD